MAELAADAHASRYEGVCALLSTLQSNAREAFDIVVRIALLPELVTSEQWGQLRGIALGSSVETVLLEAESIGLLRQLDPPAFGHTERYEAVGRCLRMTTSLRPYARDSFEHMAVELARAVKGGNEESHPYLRALGFGAVAAVQLGVKETTRLLCVGGASLSDRSVRLPESDLDALLREPALSAQAAPMLAVLARNGLVRACKRQDAGRLGALLEQLRCLSASHPADPDVCRQLAEGLGSAVLAAGERRDTSQRGVLLEELRGLHCAHPDERAVLVALAVGLSNAVVFSAKEGDADGSALLEELRDLAAGHNDDVFVRRALASGLSSTVASARRTGDLRLCGALIEELRGLIDAKPSDPLVYFLLTVGLMNGLDKADSSGFSQALLLELRSLACESVDRTRVPGHRRAGFAQRRHIHHQA